MLSEEEGESLLGHNKSGFIPRCGGYSGHLHLLVSVGNLSGRINALSGTLDLFIHLLPCG